MLIHTCENIYVYTIVDTLASEPCFNLLPTCCVSVYTFRFCYLLLGAINAIPSVLLSTWCLQHFVLAFMAISYVYTTSCRYTHTVSNILFKTYIPDWLPLPNFQFFFFIWRSSTLWRLKSKHEWEMTEYHAGS